MKLITSLEDERLDEKYWLATGPMVILIWKSLRAALEREAAIATLRDEAITLAHEAAIARNSALRERDEARKRVRVLQEAFDTQIILKEGRSEAAELFRGERDAAIAAKEEAERKLCAARKAMESAGVAISVLHAYKGPQLVGTLKSLDAALSSTSPCPHEEALKFALHEMAKGNRSRADWDATIEETRRRAAVAG